MTEGLLWCVCVCLAAREPQEPFIFERGTAFSQVVFGQLPPDLIYSDCLQLTNKETKTGRFDGSQHVQMLKQLVPRLFDSLKKNQKKPPTHDKYQVDFCTSVFRPCFPRLLAVLVCHTHPLRAGCESQPQRAPFTQNFIHVWFADLLADTSAVMTNGAIGSSTSDTGGELSLSLSQPSFRFQQRGIC